MDLLVTEGPALLGYLAFTAIVGLATLLTYLNSSEVVATRRRNRQVRHARAGCVVCRLELDTERVAR